MNKKVFLVVMAGLLCSKGLLAEEHPKVLPERRWLLHQAGLKNRKKM